MLAAVQKSPPDNKALGAERRAPHKEKGVQVKPSMIPNLCHLKLIGTDVQTQKNPVVKADKGTSAHLVQKDNHSQTENEMDELKRRIGEVFLNLTPSDFPTIKTDSFLKNSGGEIVCQLDASFKMISNKLGEDAKHTIFGFSNQVVSAFSGFHRSTITRFFDEKSKDPSKKHQKLNELSKKEKCNRIGARVTIHDKFLIRREIQRVWNEKKYINIRNLHDWAKKAIEFPYGETYFRHVLLSMGYCFKQNSRITTVEERHDILKRKDEYLKKKKNYDEKGAFYVAFDETWAHEGMAPGRCWQKKHGTPYRIARMADPGLPISGPAKGKHRGKRGIVLSMVTRDGILPGSVKFIVSGTKPEEQKSDYHADMTAKNCQTYMAEMLPLIRQAAAATGKQAVLIMDNAPYHNETLEKPPTTASKKGEIIEFLNKWNIPFSPRQTVPVLLKLSKDYVAAHGGREHFTVYKLDKWAEEEFDIKILRLPPYHCFWNPIEFVWSQLKQELRRLGTADDNLQIVRERTIRFLNEFDSGSASDLFDHCLRDEQNVREQMKERVETVEDHDFNLLYDFDQNGQLTNCHIPEDELERSAIDYNYEEENDEPLLDYDTEWSDCEILDDF